MGSIWHVRHYEESDEKGIVSLWTDCLFDPAPHNDPSLSLRQKLAVDGSLIYVAVAGQVVIGSVMGGYDGHRGWIYSLAVRPEYRRRGVGAALVRELETELQRRGCLKVNLQVRAENREVITFYEKLGFCVERHISLGKRLYSSAMDSTR